MEKFKTYINTDTNEYTSWDDDVWVTHSTPIAYPLTHNMTGFKRYMKKYYKHVFYMPKNIKLIKIEVNRLT